MTEHRERARKAASWGVGTLANALNHCNNPELRYKYAEPTQRRFQELMIELIALVEDGEILRLGTVAGTER